MSDSVKRQYVKTAVAKERQKECVCLEDKHN